MKTILFEMLRTLSILLAMSLLSSSATVNAAEAEKFFDQSLGDFKAELETAKKSGKRGLMLMFEREDCPYCLRMRETIFNLPKVQAYFRQHFLIYSIDMLGDVEIQDTAGRSIREKKYAEELRIRGTPTFVFIGTDGNILTRHTGATRDASEFMMLGKYVVDGIYKKQSFTEYRKSSH